MKRAMVSTPSPARRLLNTKGRVPRMRLASRSMTASEAPTWGARSILLITSRSERVMPGPPLDGILSPAATFSPELSDLTLYVIDVAAGDKIPRKGGPGITKSDLLVINKIDLAPMVGASLEVMDRDARRMRGERPFVFTNLKTGTGLETVIAFIEKEGLLE